VELPGDVIHILLSDAESLSYRLANLPDETIHIEMLKRRADL
jgi:hypothetical protein